MADKADYFKQKLSTGDFSRISSFVENNYGIRLPGSKLGMVQTRLIKRLMATEKPSFKEYIDFIFEPAGKAELQNMIDEITTNRTEFFREIQHFDFIKDNIVGKMSQAKVWSAGCASGEEPYSIAMMLKHHGVDCDVYASDLSVKALNEAKAGVYPDRVVKPVPADMLDAYFSKSGTDYSLNDNIKKTVKYSHINLMADTYNMPTDFDVIFFRNVSIYFSEANQDATFTKMAKHLKSNGYLILGVSENMFNQDLPFNNLKFSIFQKTS